MKFTKNFPRKICHLYGISINVCMIIPTSCLYDDSGERESINNVEVVQWVDDILHNCLFIVHAWGSGIYDIPELVGDTILQIEGNISFVVLLLMLLLCLLALPCNLRYWMNAYLHRHCNDFIPDYVVYFCVHVYSLWVMVCNAVCVCVSMQCVCVCVPLWLSVIGLLRVMTTPVYPAKCSSSIIRSILHCLLWEWWNFRCSHHRKYLFSHPVAIVEVLSSPCKFL